MRADAVLGGRALADAVDGRGAMLEERATAAGGGRYDHCDSGGAGGWPDAWVAGGPTRIGLADSIIMLGMGV